MKTATSRILLFVFLLIGIPFGYWSMQKLLGQEKKGKNQSKLDEKVQKRIDELFKEYEKVASPGYAIGVVKGKELLYGKGYGSANLDYQIPIGTHSVFSIASVSKQFTGAAIALLIMEDKLKLEMSAKDFIPELKKYPEDIQIKHLIYNCSGIPDYYRLDRPDGQSWNTLLHFDIDDCIEVVLAEEKLQFTPGEKWDYSNVNWMLLTKIVEKVSAMPFDQFMEERLFEPLAMNNSLIHKDITQVIPNRVMPYNFKTKENIEVYRESGVYVGEKGDFIQHPRISPHYGGSGVMTTIEDLSKWCINFHTKSFGGQSFYDLMHRTEAFLHGRNNQAFGLYIGDFNGKPIAAWDGGDWGISSQIKYFLEEEVAIICLANFGDGQSFRKVDQIADILVEEGIL